MQVIIPTVTTDGTFSRASSARYYNSSGVLTTAGNNVLRIGYNPSSLTDPPFAVIENASTNQLLQSEDFSNSSWTKTLITVASNTATAPDGNVTGDKLTKSSGAASVSQPFTYSATVYSFSGYFKLAATSGYVSVLLQPSYADRAGVTFNLNTGVVQGSGVAGGSGSAVVSSSIKNVGSGWYYCTFVVNCASGAGAIYIGPTENTGNFTDPFSGSTLADVYAWGVQLEASNTATSYIPTTTTTASRAADNTSNGLLYSNITEPESGYPTWSSGTTYAINDTVTYLHRRYSSLRASNLNHNPLTDTSSPPYWLDVGPTNKYAMFDTVIGTSTSSTSSVIQVVIRGDHLNGLSLMQLAADKAQISVMVDNVSVYSSTLDLTSGVLLDWYQYFYSPITRTTDYVLTDLPDVTAAIITVTITTGSGTVSIGNLVNGNIYNFLNTGCSSTASSPTVGIINYSIKTVDSFGNTKMTPRGYAKRMNVKLMLDSTSVDKAASVLSGLNAIPCVWIGADNLYQAMIVYGYYKDWEIEIAYTTKSYCTLTVEGLI